MTTSTSNSMSTQLTSAPSLRRRRGGQAADADSPMLRLPTQQVQDTLFHGWLWKRGALFKTWKQRYFVLNGRALTFYAQCCVVTSTRFGSRCVDLPSEGGFRVQSAQLSTAASFAIEIHGTNGQRLVVQAGDAVARQQWLGALNNATATAPAHSIANSDGCSSDIESATESDIDSDSDSSSTTGSLSTVSSQDDLDTLEMRGWLQPSAKHGSIHHDDHDASDAARLSKHRVSLSGTRLRVASASKSTSAHKTLLSRRHSRETAFDVLAVARWVGHEHGLRVQLSDRQTLLLQATSQAEAALWEQRLLQCL